ncbi:MAG: hypothetical protein HUU50_08470 [Candidatus Brocadiae bacterium]|nr:hypothetical protein [Candidatus Brocadiia bacterium]
MSNKNVRHKQSKNTHLLSSSIAENEPLYGCWINQEWKSAGYAYIFVARKRKTGLIAFAAFWIDIVKDIIEKCAMECNSTEDFFQKNILKKNPDIAFLAVEISLVQEIIFQAETKMQSSQKPLPDLYLDCKTMLGPEQEITKAKQPQNAPCKENFTFCYSVRDQESTEANMRQIDALEECEDSEPGHRSFHWKEQKKQGFFSKSKEKFCLGKVVLEKDKLWLEVFDEKNAKYLQNSLIQYLGTSVESILS